MAHRDPSVDDNFLVRASVKPETLRRYLGAVSGFLLYCEERDLEAYDEWDLDRHLRTYIHHLYRAGASRQMAAYAVYGVQLLLGKRYSLHTAKRALNGWSRLEPSQPRPPMPYEVMLLSALWLGRRGGRAAGAAMVVAFHGLLRISELLGLRVGDVAGPRSPGAQRSHAAWVLALPRTKTGSNQHVVIDDPLACALLASWTAGRGSDERLFGLSDYAFRKALKEAGEALQLGHIGYVPHSLRHGGATYLHSLGWSLQDIQKKGRWKISDTAGHYIQAGRALVLSQRIPAEVMTFGKLLASPAGQELLLHSLRRSSP